VSSFQRKQELIDELHNIHASDIKHINADEDSVEMQLSSLMSCMEFSRKVSKHGSLSIQMNHFTAINQILRSYQRMYFA